MSASIPGGPGTPLIVTFDETLAPEAGRPTAPWFARQGSAQILITSVAATGFAVTMNTAAGGLDPGPDEVTYDGTDPLIRGITGLPVAAFSVPLT